MKLKDKVAVITGGAGGIGAAIGRRYAAEGARVVIADRPGVDTQALTTELGNGSFGVGLDVSSTASIASMVETVTTAAGGIDILVNNAGVFEMAPILDITEEAYDRLFAVNVRGMLFTLQAVARRMVAQGRGGKIINLSSQGGRRGSALVGLYGASKAAVISLTQSAALGLIEHRINVNGIAPGFIDTPMWDHVDALYAKYENLPLGEKKRQVGASVPYGRMGTADDLAGAALFLASADADYMVAQTLDVNGGTWMS